MTPGTSNGVTPAVPLTRMVPGPPHVIDMHWIGRNPVHENAVAGTTEQVLSRLMSQGGIVQVIWPESLTWSALVATAVAVLFITVQAAGLVAAVTTAVKVAPCRKSTPKLQFSVCDPIEPLTVHPLVAVVQFTPPPAGSGSLTVPFFAFPGPL